jgi:acyl dehydratase
VSWEQGQALEPQTYSVTRADLVAYAGASGDLNPIHWSDRVATSVGLPGVVAHGMYTMALAARALTAWAGDPGRIAEFGVRFTRPVLVPDDDTGTTVEVAGTVTAVEAGLARITVAVTVDGVGVLGQARAQVRVDADHG